MIATAVVVAHVWFSERNYCQFEFIYVCLLYENAIPIKNNETYNAGEL